MPTPLWQGCCLLRGGRCTGGKGIMDFSNYESMRHRMDEIRKRLAAQRRVRKAAGSERQCSQESES